MSFRHLPSVDALIREVRAGQPDAPHELLRDAAQAVLAQARKAIAAGSPPPSLPALVAAVHAELAASVAPSLRPLINATGVVIQTNLGRAPLSAAARAAMQAVGAGYSNLEYDLVEGERGSRHVHLEQLLVRLTGAEAALVVNNNAAAVYLALIALAAGREVIVSRGQAVEIGGGFRIPDVLRASGATLVEVGTTNRTYVRDYAAAISERTALILRVHASNFRLIGFMHEPELAELAEVAHQHGLPLLDDLGSGTLIDTRQFGLQAEPTVQASVAAGADLVTFSGDKLLGGPQAGIIVGRRDLVGQLRRHPLARALRVDKSTIAGLAATLHSYLRGAALREIPVWQLISTPVTALQQRAEAMAATLVAASLPARAIACESAIGGGSLPGATQPSFGVALTPASSNATALAARLRAGDPPVVARIVDEQVVCDLRSVFPAEDATLAAALIAAYR
ncbi:L-seryl-tRNA(Sec) selenium transferase [Chloroflexus islandicus]|uniref:L-seryl-tRNA(Sec) selenium transferase n=1 Tax=Chloroflexus islandicus TaxID=1707952 RepID=A0A178MC88_9CHLR|nr:L-seryl-tRNA(Sec) selenium transferase [Chloroflexus islandicus]OAN45474.1 L-seryl-tRNA(Sec) selenium transferase [Chloroflexus islandicus]